MKALLLVLLAAASIAQAAFWMETIRHQGVSSFNQDKSYQVFRNIKSFGAKGDGVTDDTNAINTAISSGNRCGGMTGCNGSTTTPAVVYFPGGTYLISKPIVDYYYTQIIGDPNDMPVIKASANFTVGALALLDADLYMHTGALEFRSTNVFYRQVRNMVFDTTAVPGVATGIHWPSAQATSIQNCVFKLSPRPADGHTGIFIEEGSGGIMNDLVFYGGQFGARFGNQQYTMRNLTFYGSDTAIEQIWDWGWTYKSLSINNCRIGINMSSTDVGSVTLLDSVFNNVSTALLTGRNPGNTTGIGSLVIENVQYNNVPTVLMGPNEEIILLGDPAGSVFDRGYARGNLYAPYGPTLLEGSDYAHFNQPPALKSGNKYYERSKPQYETLPASSFFSARDYGAVGDGKTDDTAALNRLFQASADNQTIAFLDAGYYSVGDTVYVPAGARIVGEGLAAVIMGAGPRFSDMSKPHSVVRVGMPGEVGYIEMSDLIVSTQGATAGAVLIEYNLDTPAGKPAPNLCDNTSGNQPSGLWDVHVRVGGFAGSQLQLEQCPTTPLQNNYVPPTCIAAYMSMHVTKTAGNLYVENSWLWVADHDIEDWNCTQISVFAGRGLLIEADRIWLVGHAVEHHTLYQYQIVNASDIFMGQIQTESPYYQPNPPAPAPFHQLNSDLHDPDFDFDCKTVTYASSANVANGSLSLPGHPPCAMAWGLRILGSHNIVGFGAGLYSFFNNYDTNCSTVAAGENCQARIFWVGPLVDVAASDTNGTKVGGKLDMSTIAVYNLNTVGSVSMVTRQGTDVAAWMQNGATFAATLAVFQS
ncbi:pectate lyase superfamily protein-domain-containing protein [Apodospora peruviana]|uniref:Pectate lyase superfamily protein-domain-containing protein n=1 Tax=Apodospora peruviana TaxID=516989 RepID=A0AAE0IUH9_9PEZI|nr:pectate lyase superfamily protein-domain-containing protein [Apodospora peruviana]